MKALLGNKEGMTSLFNEKGERVAVTVINASGCRVVDLKNSERDGYDAVCLGFGEVLEKRLNRPMKGRFAKLEVPPARHLREVRLSRTEGWERGGEVKASLFKVGDRVTVTGVTKGRGFQGVVKRHGKAGGPASHGSRFHRTTGSIGQRTSPGEVFKNMKLPGRMGGDRVTVHNLTVVEVKDPYLFLKGGIPGPSKGLVLVRGA